jgi:UrcA family protein
MRTMMLSFVAAAVIATGTPALAEAPAANGVITLAGFDLATPGGQSRLNQTIRRTALQMCSTESTIDLPQAKRLQRLCYEDAVANANAQIAGRTAERATVGNSLAALDTAAPIANHN